MERQTVSKSDIVSEEVIKRQSKFRILKKTWDGCDRVEYHIQQFDRFGFLRRWYNGYNGRWETMDNTQYGSYVGRWVFSNRNYTDEQTKHNCVTAYNIIVADYISINTEPKEEIIRED